MKEANCSFFHQIISAFHKEVYTSEAGDAIASGRPLVLQCTAKREGLRPTERNVIENEETHLLFLHRYSLEINCVIPGLFVVDCG